MSVQRPLLRRPTEDGFSRRCFRVDTRTACEAAIREFVRHITRNDPATCVNVPN
jgi:hypothetical protein